MFICLASTVNRLAILDSEGELIKSSKMTKTGCPEAPDLISSTTVSLSSMKLSKKKYNFAILEWIS